MKILRQNDRQLVQSGTGQYTRILAIYQIPIGKYQQKIIMKIDEHHALKVLHCGPFIQSQQQTIVLSLHLFMFRLCSASLPMFFIFCSDFFSTIKIFKNQYFDNKELWMLDNELK